MDWGSVIRNILDGCLVGVNLLLSQLDWVCTVVDGFVPMDGLAEGGLEVPTGLPSQEMEGFVPDEV